MITLIVNIKELLQVRETAIDKVCGAEMAILPTIKNAFFSNQHLIVDFGSMDQLPKINADKTIDATGKWFYLLV
jgi:imidazolonepropionase